AQTQRGGLCFPCEDTANRSSNRAAVRVDRTESQGQRPSHTLLVMGRSCEASVVKKETPPSKQK
ncbi:Hypothetical predicted protein, partial [Lynx pardinus]